MKLQKEIIDTFNTLQLLIRHRPPSCPIKIEVSLEKAERSINSKNWENRVLDKTGDLTAYLSKYEPDLDKFWNQLVQEFKELAMPSIEKQLNQLVEAHLLTQDMVDPIKFDLVGIGVYQAYKMEKSSITSPFLDDLFEIYQSGYIPCGWIGIGKVGKFLIY